MISAVLTFLQILPWTLFPGIVSDTTESTVYKDGRVSVAIVLPMTNKAGEGNGNFDFYCGALLGAKTLGEQGIEIDISAYDLNTEYPLASDLKEKELILGPVEAKDITSLSQRIDDSTSFIISPLDAKISGIADSVRVIQAPVSWQLQAQDLVLWMLEDKRASDTVLIVEKSEAVRSEYGDFIVNLLDTLGIRYHKLSYAPTDGLTINDSYRNVASRNGVTRIFITSDDEAFVNDVIRNVSMLKLDNLEAVLYCPSKVRNFELMDISNLYNANVRFTSCYMIDYSDPQVKNFILKYRALYQCEPNAFAFQGYDLINFFVKQVYEYGSDWLDTLQNVKGNGLQTSFKFSKEGKGLLNKAVRRVCYNPDYSITIQK